MSAVSRIAAFYEQQHRRLGKLHGDSATGYLSGIRDTLEFMKKQPDRATEQELQRARRQAWEEGRQAFIQAPYPKNPYEEPVAAPQSVEAD